MGGRMKFGLAVAILATPLIMAACGSDDDVAIVAQPGPGGAGSGAWLVPDNTISPALIAAFTGAPDNLYFNVHTSANPDGEIRGQLDGSGAVRFATLTGAQETPPVTTAAFGAGALVVDNVTNQVRGFVATFGLTGTLAHIHNAARGVPGPVVVPLTGGPNLWVVPDNTISPALVAIFNAAPDNLYFNVHTTANSDGEIRGQLDASGAVRLATLDGAQETPPVTTTALGGGVMSVDTVTNRVAGFLVSSGLTGTLAHIHNAARGVPGPVVVPLTGGPNLWVVPDNTISPALAAIFNAAPDNLYYNVHTAANSDGEIRGQLDASGAMRFATLNGTQETPPVTTAAFGGGVMSVDNVTNRVGGFVATSGLTGTLAHIHNAARGVPGPVIVPLLPAP